MALIALVYHVSPGSVLALAHLLFFTVVPVLVIGPFAGVYVDRWDRKLVMIISDVVRGVLVLAIPLFITLGLMFPIYVIVFLVFSATRFFLPSKLAIIPELVDDKDSLIVANSLSNTTRMIATVLGFAVAGYIVKLVGFVWGFYLNSLSYFVSAIFIAIITPKKKLVDVKEELQMTKEIIGKSLRKHLWAELIEGFHHMYRKDKMKIVTSTMFLLMGGAGSIFCVIIVFIQESFGSVTEDLGVFGIFLGAGLFAGTVIYGKIGDRVSKIGTLFMSLALSGIAIMCFALYISSYPVLLIGGSLIFLTGMAIAPVFACTNTLIHTLVPEEVWGRMFSSLEAVMHLAFILFMFLTAWLSKFVPNYYILMASGIAFALAGVLGYVSIRNKWMEA